MPFSNPYTAADLDAIAQARRNEIVKDPTLDEVVPWDKAAIDSRSQQIASVLNGLPSLTEGPFVQGSVAPKVGNTKAAVVSWKTNIQHTQLVIDWGAGSPETITSSAMEGSNEHVYTDTTAKTITVTVGSKSHTLSFTPV